MAPKKDRAISKGLSDSFYHMDTENPQDEEEFDELPQPSPSPSQVTSSPPNESNVNRDSNPSRIDHSSAPESTIYCDVCVIS